MVQVHLKRIDPLQKSSGQRVVTYRKIKKIADLFNVYNGLKLELITALSPYPQKCKKQTLRKNACMCTSGTGTGPTHPAIKMWPQYFRYWRAFKIHMYKQKPVNKIIENEWKVTIIYVSTQFLTCSFFISYAFGQITHKLYYSAISIRVRINQNVKLLTSPTLIFHPDYSSPEPRISFARPDLQAPPTLIYSEGVMGCS